MKPFLSAQYKFVRSPQFEKMLHEIEENGTWSKEKIFREIVKPNDPSIGKTSFTNWYDKWIEFKDEQVKTITNSILERAIDKELDNKRFYAIIDQMFEDKLTEEQIENLSLKDLMLMRKEVGKLSQEDQKIQLKKKEDKREETMFGLALGAALSGNIEEDDNDFIEGSARVIE